MIFIATSKVCAAFPLTHSSPLNRAAPSLLVITERLQDVSSLFRRCPLQKVPNGQMEHAIDVKLRKPLFL